LLRIEAGFSALQARKSSIVIELKLDQDYARKT